MRESEDACYIGKRTTMVRDTLEMLTCGKLKSTGTQLRGAAAPRLVLVGEAETVRWFGEVVW